MAHLVEFPLDGGGTVLVESAEPSEHAVTTRGWREDGAEQVAERVEQSFQAAVAKIQPATEALLNSLVDQARTPQEVQVEFAVELSAKAGAYIATLGSTANFKITLTWRPGPDSD